MCQQDDHVSAVASESDDRHLHESQIPPPYQQPSQDDVNTMLTKVFETMDKNDDTKVDSDELKQWLDKIHEGLIDDNVEQQWTYYSPPLQEVHSWESYDPEKREALIWDHYINTTYTDDVVQAYRQDVNIDEFKSDDPNFKSYYTMLKRAERRWKVADKNNDTVLIKEEFKFFLHPEESDHTKHLLVEEAMEDMDLDGNKEITLEEYMKHMNEVTPEQEKQDPGFESNHQSQFQTYLDKNKDGNLCMTELSEWLIPSYDRHEAEATRMIHDTDNDHDQKLNQQELLGNNQYFLSLIPGEMWRQYSQQTDGDSTTAATHDEF
ncbi:actin-related 3-like protein [Dermatophagoides farinae]|uniref:Actin-related 3-like protein n=1 Tax=Dermatophagoides farinae TaxID=6954 RepID=A0A9D4SLC8_DERFA|nr:actin-related 3-like protein [Dermatophagoides farinae]